MRKKKQNGIIQRSIQCLYTLYKTEGGITADLMNVQAQTDYFNCGVFAIAYAADILSGISPIMSVYDVDKMRSHFIKCLEEEELTPFPKLLVGRKRKTIESSIDVMTF